MLNFANFNRVKVSKNVLTFTDKQDPANQVIVVFLQGYNKNQMFIRLGGEVHYQTFLPKGIPFMTFGNQVKEILDYLQ